MNIHCGDMEVATLEGICARGILEAFVKHAIKKKSGLTHAYIEHANEKKGRLIYY